MIIRILFVTLLTPFLFEAPVCGQSPQTKSIPEIDGVVVAEDGLENPKDDPSEKSKKRSKTKRSRSQRNSMDHFMRVRKSGKKKPVSFETSITRYIAKNDDDETVYVDLIGVVHIGEKSYYEDLNKVFEAYDAVLYELVAPEGMVPQPNAQREGFNPIAALQMGMQSALGLEFQLKHIDYKKDNFVHADMSPAEFMESMKSNDESFGKIMLKAVGQSLAQSSRNQVSNFDLLRVAFAKDKEIKMRQLFATQMIDMEGGMQIFEGRDGSTIINHRNGKAMRVLAEELNDGKKKVAIFYGAGHLPDMERRLISDFQMKRAGQYWLEAWKLVR